MMVKKLKLNFDDDKYYHLTAKISKEEYERYDGIHHETDRFLDSMREYFLGNSHMERVTGSFDRVGSMLDKYAEYRAAQYYKRTIFKDMQTLLSRMYEWNEMKEDMLEGIVDVGDLLS